MSKINELEEHEEEQGGIWYIDQEGYRLEIRSYLKIVVVLI